MRRCDPCTTRPTSATLRRIAALALPALAWLMAASLAVAQVQQAPAGAQATPPPLPPPQLAGQWDLNVQASDPTPVREPQQGEGEQGRGSQGDQGDQGGGGDRGGRGGYGGYGGYGGSGGYGGHRGPDSHIDRTSSKQPDSEAVRQQIERALAAPRFLIIVQHPGRLSLTDDEGRVTTLKPDGTKVAEQQAGGSVERTTAWNDRALVTTLKLANGAKVTQTFTKVFDGLQLVVVTRIEGGRLPSPIELKRVYDQALQ
jgi:hypothetical protein